MHSAKPRGTSSMNILTIE